MKGVVCMGSFGWSFRRSSSILPILDVVGNSDDISSENESLMLKEATDIFHTASLFKARITTPNRLFLCSSKIQMQFALIFPSEDAIDSFIEVI